MSILDLLMPPACAGCGRTGALLCPRCAATVRPPGTPADRFVASDPGVVVGDALALAIAAHAYEGPMRRALAALKYGGISRLAPILARLSAGALADLLAIAGPDARLIPIPIHVERLRARGYNQAELLARELGRQHSVPVSDVLVRTRPTTKQHRLNRRARLHNLRGAFGVPDSRPVPPSAILVDDILTTSATLEACASVLRDAGCEIVDGFAIAREV